MKRMSENTRPVPGPSAARDDSQGGSGGGGQRSRKGGQGRKRRRRRGSGQGGNNRAHNGQSQNQNQSQHQSQSQGHNQNGQSQDQNQSQNKNKDNSQSQNKNSKNNKHRNNRNKNRNRNRNNNRNRNRSNNRNNQRRRPQYEREHDSNIPTRDETSAGGLVVSGMAEAVGKDGKVDMSRIYVALIGRLDRRGRLLWSMPKGHVEDGEHQWVTAEREVWEETGITGEAFDTLGVIDYWFVSDGVRIHKTVHHNLLRYVDGVFNDEDPEVTEVTWVPMSELMEHLAYADERKLARIACDRMPDLARKEADAGRATPR